MSPSGYDVTPGPEPALFESDPRRIGSEIVPPKGEVDAATPARPRQLARSRDPLFTPTARAAPVTVKVMTLNVFGGDEWNLATGQWCPNPAGCPETMGHVVSTIRAADADIVGLQEGTANECVIADRLGWHCEPRLQLISRYPLLDPGGRRRVRARRGHPGTVRRDLERPSAGRSVRPVLVRDGEPRAAVLDLERTTRLPAIQRELDVLWLADAGMPVFLTGDFNSHPIWTGRRRSMPSARRSVPGRLAGLGGPRRRGFP